MPISIPDNTNTQYDLSLSNQIWTLAEGSTLTSPNGHGISEAAQYHDNLIGVNGSITALSYGSGGVVLQGDGSTVVVGTNGSIEAWHGIELFGDAQGAVNNGTLSIRGIGISVDGAGSSVTNNGLITAHGLAEADVSGIAADGGTEVLNSASGVIDVTGDAITVRSLWDEETDVTNFGSVSGDGLSFYGWTGNETLINRGSMAGDIQMGAGNDIFDGLGGSVAGVVMGGQGDDLYRVDSAKTRLQEKAGEGTDSVQARTTWTLGENFENLALSGGGKINGIGNELANILTGNAKANTLKGLRGADELDGGKGNDVMTGGLGGDTFHFASGYGKDRITDFSDGSDAVDLSDLSGVTGFRDLQKNHLFVSGDDLVIRSGADRLTIEDVKLSEIDARDFDF